MNEVQDDCTPNPWAAAQGLSEGLASHLEAIARLLAEAVHLTWPPSRCFHGGRSAPALTDAPPRSLLRSACLTLCAAPHNLGLQGADCGQECLSRPERAAPSGTPAEKSLSLAFSAPQASSATSLSSLLLKDVCSPRVCAACLTLC